MQSKILAKLTLVIVIFAVSALFLTLLYYFISSANLTQNGLIPIIENAAVLSKQGQANFGLPLRLKIPSIDVNASIEYVGLTQDGAMDVPKGQDTVAWFEPGQRPGENGSAVIAGHYGLKDGKASVFDDLHKLRKGDTIYIEDDKGAVISFVVRESRRYDPKADASNVFGSNDGRSHLNLVTCEGVWDEATKSFSQRLVVFTDKE